jgi:PAS domain S-box-containing protein
METALQESEEKYRTLIENIQDGVFLIQDGELKFVNEAFARIPGYTVDEVRGMNFGGLVAPEDLDVVVDRYARMMAGECVPREYEFHGIQKDGATRITLHMTVGLIDYHGKPAALGTVKDITKHKAMEDALRESEIMYRALYDSSRDAIMMMTPQGEIFSGNSATLEMFGCKDEEEFTSMTVANISPEYQPDGSRSLPESLKAMSIAMAEGSHFFEWKHRQRGGDEFFADVLLTQVKLDHKEFLQATVRDITRRKIAEAALCESEEKYRTLIENIQDGVFLIQGGELKFVNEAFARIPDYTVEEILGMNFGGLVAPEDLDMVADRYVRMMAGEDVPMEYEFQGVRKGDDMRTTVRMTVGLTEYRGKPAVIGTVKDITEQKSMENALRESEERFRMIFENMSDAVAVYGVIDEGRDFILKDFNQSAEKLEDMKRKDLIGKSLLDVFSGAVDFGLLDVFQRVWRTGNPEHHPISLYNDERIVGFRENYVYKLPSGEIIAIYEDVTERKRRVVA